MTSTTVRIPEAGRAGGALTRCTGDANAFLRDTWGRRATVHGSVDAQGFSDLLTLDDVDRLLSSTFLRTPTFRLVKAGETIPEPSYTRSGRTGSKPVSGMADPARIAELFRGGATIVLQGLHRYHEPVTRLCRDLELELGHPCQVNAYITPPGTQGLELHVDPHDVFVLQAFGRKSWEIHAAPNEAERQPIHAEIGAGDCVYMPTGTSHAASTPAAVSGPSGHLTVGVHVTPWRDVVAHAIQGLEATPSLDDPVPAGWTHDPDAFATELASRLRSASEALGSVNVEGLARARRDRFLSTRSPLLRGAIAAAIETEPIGSATRLVRRGGTVCDVRVAGDGLVVLLGDRRLHMPGWLEPAMRQIADVETLTADDLSDSIADPASRLVLVRRLVREGLFLVDDGR
ncbi:MAG: cupin domain-containing protein [Actinomycetota bacterium]